MSDIQFLVLLAVQVWLWWIVPRRREVTIDTQKLLNCFERIETKLGTNPDLADKLWGTMREESASQDQGTR